MPAKNSDTSLIGLLEIPLGSSRVGPTKRRDEDLHHIAHQLDRARNAAAATWMKWRWDHPDWQPAQVIRDGKPVFTKSSKPIYAEGSLYPKRVDHNGEICGDDDGTGFETWIYHEARKVAPDVAGTLVSSIVREVLSNLKTDIQHHHTGHKWRWQAILAHDESMPTFKARTIPVPNNSSSLCIDGSSTGKNKDAKKFSVSGASFQCPLFSKLAGRHQTAMLSVLPIASLSPGNREVVRKVASGVFEFSDSKLVFKKDRWQLQLTYKRPAQNLGLDKKRVATLWPQFPESARPFIVEASGPKWQCGNGRWLEMEFKNLEQRREQLHAKYRTATPGMKGHGKGRFFKRFRPMSRKTKNIQRHFTWTLITDVVNFCKRFNCGSVVYREPHVATRDHLWMAKFGVPFDWTSLLTDLGHKLKFYGIDFKCERINAAELRERLGGDEKPGFARNSEVKCGKEVAKKDDKKGLPRGRCK